MKSVTSSIIVLCGVLAVGVPFAVGNAAAEDTTPGAAPATEQPADQPAPKPAKVPAKHVKKVVETSQTWTGDLAEVGRSKTFPVTLTLKGKGGETTYPSQNCTGKLTRAGSSGDYSFFTETISSGKFDPATKTGCVDGSLTLIKSGAGVVIGWFGAEGGKPIVAFGTLTPKAP